MIFASASLPLRASSLPTLLQCPEGHHLKHQHPDAGNAAAQTGTMIHAGIDAFHKSGSPDVALAVMASKRTELPLADTGKAAKCFRTYAEREGQWGEVVETETKVTARLDPHPLDPTQEAVVIVGTADMVRRISGALWLVDAKTGGRLTGDVMVAEHAPQLAAYMVGVSQARGGCPVNGAVLRTADFLTGGPAFRPVGFDLAGAYRILDAVRLFVAQVRAGFRVRIPGEHCRWCPAGSVGNCLQGKLAAAGFAEHLTSIGDLM